MCASSSLVDAWNLSIRGVYIVVSRASHQEESQLTSYQNRSHGFPPWWTVMRGYRRPCPWRTRF